MITPRSSTETFRTPREMPLSDLDATPRPLNIVKRRLTKPVSHVSIASSIGWTQHRRPAALAIPKRCSSISLSGFGGLTDSDAASFHTALPGLSPSPARSESLKVRKRRCRDTHHVQSEEELPTKNDILVASESECVTSQPSPPWAENCVPENFERGHHLESGPRRAVTAGHIVVPQEQARQQNLGRGGGIMPSRPFSARSTFHRTASARPADEAVRSSDQLLVAGKEDVIRHPSFKHRLLNRIASGFLPPAKHDSLVRDGRKPQRHSVRGPLNFADSPSQISIARESLDTTASTETTSSSTSIISRTIELFPAPPPHGPVVRSDNREVGIYHPAASPRKYSIDPRPVRVMSADMALFQEFANAKAMETKSLFIAVDIEGVLRGAVSESILSEGFALDFAIVLDNSMYSSPSTFMACCETAIFMTQLFDNKDDRLVILRTHSTTNDRAFGYAITPFKKLSTRRAKLSLDNLELSQVRPEVNYFEGAMKEAENIVLQPQKSPLRKRVGAHIIVLTANPAAVQSSIIQSDKVQVHVVCPGIKRWKDPRPISTNGWYICDRPRQIESSRRRFSSSMESVVHAGLRQLELYARNGLISESLADVQVSINPGENCSIEGVMGPTEVAHLYPGEVRTVLVKVKVKLDSPGTPALALFPRGIRTRSGGMDLEKELDAILGPRRVTILTSKLKYSHPALLEGTVCEVTKNAELCVQGFDFDTVPLEPDISDAFGLEAIQIRLIQHLATHQNPRHAINTLNSQFGTAGELSRCPGYIMTVEAELRYQARILERLTATDDLSLPFPIATPRLRPINVPMSRYCLKPENLPAQSTPNLQPPPHLTEKRKSVSPSRIPVKANQRLKSPEPFDQAQKIWSDIRRKTRFVGRENLAPTRERFSLKEIGSQDTLRRIQETAARNDRVVGQDTLKSLRYDVNRRSENVAPWL